SVAPRGSQVFTASGGSGAGFTWSLTTNASGGAIASSGAYVAGPNGGVIDVVEARDSLGNSATASITVTAGITLSPMNPTLAPKGSMSFIASGGNGAPFTWSLTTNASGGAIGAATGVYAAGA